jgi:uncharacterized phiE125 gp8 family phage protein
MYAPVRTQPPQNPVVSLDEAKANMRVDHGDDDALIEGLIAAATDHLEGWTGILGRCLVEQEWRQDFDHFESCLPLPLGPVQSIVSVTWRNRAGQLSTVAASAYSRRTDAAGRSSCRFQNDFSFPNDLYQVAAVSVTYRAGYPDTEGEDPQSTVPAAIRTAILLMVANWYQNSSAVNVGNIVSEMPLGVTALLSPYRRVGI